MSNIIKFPPPSPSSKKENTTSFSDDYTSELAKKFTHRLTNQEKREKIKKIKELLVCRGVKYRASPPVGVNIKKNPFLFFFPEKNVGFWLGVIKNQPTAEGWLIHQMAEKDDPAVIVGKILDIIRGSQYGIETQKRN